MIFLVLIAALNGGVFITTPSAIVAAGVADTGAYLYFYKIGYRDGVNDDYGRIHKP